MLQKLKELLAKASMIYTLALNLLSNIRDIFGGLKKSVSRQESKTSQKNKES